MRYTAAFVGMMIAWLIIFVVGAFMLFSGCTSPTSPDAPQTANERLAVEFANCHTDFYGKPRVQVFFVDDIRSDGAVAWGWNGAITLVRPALESWSPADIELVVGIEVAHAALGILSEDLAVMVAFETVEKAGCR